MSALTFYIVFHVSNRTVMLCGCQGDKWAIECLMANEGLFWYLFDGFISLILFNDDVCVGSNFVDGDIVVGYFSIFSIWATRSLLG